MALPLPLPLPVAAAAGSSPPGKKSVLFTRFTNQYVSAGYDVFPMEGPRGGGFIFDTNAVHKGQVRGLESRDVVMVEYVAAAKHRAAPFA